MRVELESVEQKEFRVAAALLAVVVLGIVGIFYVRVSGAESLRDAFADPYGSSPWGDYDDEDYDACFELYERVGLWGFSGDRAYTTDTHTESLPDGSYRTATLAMTAFADAEEARRNQEAREAAFGQLRNSDCFELLDDYAEVEVVAPLVLAADGLGWAFLVDYAYDDSGEPSRREVYIWHEGPHAATLDLWVDDTDGGAAFVREQHRRALADVRDASR